MVGHFLLLTFSLRPPAASKVWATLEQLGIQVSKNTWVLVGVLEAICSLQLIANLLGQVKLKHKIELRSLEESSYPVHLKLPRPWVLGAEGEE